VKLYRSVVADKHISAITAHTLAGGADTIQKDLSSANVKSFTVNKFDRPSFLTRSHLNRFLYLFRSANVNGLFPFLKLPGSKSASYLAIQLRK